MIQVALCDDEDNILRELCDSTKAAFRAAGVPAQVKGFSNAAELWRGWERDPNEVVFLDIEMPEVDGISFGKFLRARNLNPCIIYLSNRDDRVFETFQVTPLRFIRKSRFHEEIDEAVSAITQWRESSRRRTLLITSRDSIESLNIDDIIYVESFGKTQSIVTADRTYSQKETLRELENKLSEYGFLRPHQGYLVNSRHIDRIERDVIVMQNGTKIPVSKYKVTETKNAFLRFTTDSLIFHAPAFTGALQQ